MESARVILVALDLEAGSDGVLARAAQLAAAHAARLVVLHVVEADSWPEAASIAGRSESELQNQLERQALAAIEPLLIAHERERRTDVLIDFGSPRNVITRVARERYADVIVVGPGKGHSLKEKILGSTADRVIRAAPAPILVVRRQSAEPYGSVAVAVDFSTQSEMAVKETRRLAPEAVFQLAHVIDIPLPFQQTLLRAGTSQAEIEKYHSAMAAKAREDLTAFARSAVGHDKVDLRVLEGEPGPALVGFAKSHRIDLLAMGSHGRSVVLQALLGSVAQRVLREAECDVLVVNAVPR